MVTAEQAAIAAYDARSIRQRDKFLYGPGGPPRSAKAEAYRWQQWRARKDARAVIVQQARDRRRRIAKRIREEDRQRVLKHWLNAWKNKQRTKTLKAIAAGVIHRTPCRLCGTARKEHGNHAHHWSYAAPLDVACVCQRCHTTVHRVHDAVYRAWISEIEPSVYCGLRCNC